VIKKLEEYKLHIDSHRILIFYYKFACLYFGSGDNEKAIEYLNLIINRKPDLRTDIHCYARLLHLIAHFEMGNYNLVEYLIKSVYRFMAKMKNLSIVEEEIFAFLKKSFSLSQSEIIPAFKSLKNKLEALRGNPLATRSFMYLDIIGWLESKIDNVPVQQIIRDKYLISKKNRMPANKQLV
jgi:tetratricopeptide (TPR) repeat protein